jgi:hypothetical protein
MTEMMALRDGWVTQGGEDRGNNEILALKDMISEAHWMNNNHDIKRG